MVDCSSMYEILQRCREQREILDMRSIIVRQTDPVVHLFFSAREFSVCENVHLGRVWSSAFRRNHMPQELSRCLPNGALRRIKGETSAANAIENQSNMKKMIFPSAREDQHGREAAPAAHPP